MYARKGEKNDFGFCADDGNLEDMEKERVSLLKTCEIKSAGLNFTMTNHISPRAGPDPHELQQR